MPIETRFAERAHASELPGSGITFRDAPPPASLVPWVASCWSLVIAADSTARHYWVAPDGGAHLVVRDGRIRLSGPATRTTRRPATRGMLTFGLRLHAGAARAFLGLGGVVTLRDRTLAMSGHRHLHDLVVWAREARALRSLDEFVSSAESAFRVLVMRADRPDVAVTAAIRAIQSAADRPPGVERLAALTGLSSRQLRRRFVAAVDLTPREYALVWRFRRSVLELLARSDESWSVRAASHGFADQSHLIREYRRLGGMTPQEFVRRLRNVAHERVWDPRRLDVEPVATP